ncbi:glucokinase [Marinobacterium nitratireducens]|uniref:Glucokinase n=1 Tax=Marinobacterium nitratireducens TaxID=518897 RepID=A0A917ZQ08_9GAMM|nr:glucokinase [Marinobacterium nitratireducens]GGO87361.1 glucokinase [Marinobacterium nitratireducens]
MSEYALVGDIGGTNARLALVKPGSVALEAVRTLACADYENLDDACFAYLAEVGIAGVDRACLAFACPVQGERLRMTNNHWAFHRGEMQRRLGLSELRLLNDFTAMALGMLHIEPSDLLELGGGSVLEGNPKLVIGPGTGLGVSALVPAGDEWVPLATEGGHVGFAPTDEAEVAIWRHLKERYGRVSVERILCGQGLVNLYQALAAYHSQPAPLSQPPEITAAAQAGDTLAEETLSRFCRILGEQAGDAVLTLGARGGVYLCGGILPRIRDCLMASDFRRGFEAKGRFADYMKQVPVWLCTAEMPGLLGAAAGLNNSLAGR